MRVLLITAKFPPDTGVGTFRIAKFAKYLSRMDCEVFVLSRKNSGTQSDVLLGDVENVNKVIRTPGTPPRIIDEILKTTSQEFNWPIQLAKMGVDVVKEYNVDVMVQTVPERIGVYGGIYVKNRTDVPAILDLRDPIIDPRWDSGNWGMKNKVYHKISNHLERKAVRNFDNIVLTSQMMQSTYESRYPNAASKLHTITNGFDPEVIPRKCKKDHNQFRIIFVGKFRDDMSWFFRPFSQFVKDRPDVKFIHFGDPNHYGTVNVKKTVDKFDLNSNVSFKGYLPRDEVFSEISASNVGMVSTYPDDNTRVPTKVFDYIGCNIPILAGDDGESALREILTRFEHAQVHNRNSSVEIMDSLCKFYSCQPRELGDAKEIRQYSREKLTRDLLGLIEDTVDK